MGTALGGWEVSGVVVYNSGLPLTVTSSLGNDPGGLGRVNNASSSAGVRPDATGNPYAGSDIGTIYKWFNTAAFAEVPVGQVRPGNAGRTIITAPGIVGWNSSLFKNFAIRERLKLQLRGEAFNVLNHANFSPPTLALGNPNFGGLKFAWLRTLNASPRNCNFKRSLIAKFLKSELFQPTMPGAVMIVRPALPGRTCPTGTSANAAVLNHL